MPPTFDKLMETYGMLLCHFVPYWEHLLEEVYSETRDVVDPDVLRAIRAMYKVVSYHQTNIRQTGSLLHVCQRNNTELNRHEAMLHLTRVMTNDCPPTDAKLDALFTLAIESVKASRPALRARHKALQAGGHAVLASHVSTLLIYIAGVLAIEARLRAQPAHEKWHTVKDLQVMGRPV